MSRAIPVEYNGHVFVPLIMIDDLPEGTRCVAHIPSLKPPPPVTEEHKRVWAEICRALVQTVPPFPTVEEAMRVSRGRP
jgi:hypothetical protein